MALPAFAEDRFATGGHFPPTGQLRTANVAADREQIPSWHQQQADRGLNRPARRAHRHSVKLPILVRIGVIGFGAVLGWAVPIAIAVTLVH